MTIDALSDDALLEIFTHYILEDSESYVYDIESWHTLVHVCRRWRHIVFDYPRRLNLQIRCTPRTRVTTTLSVWPALLIVIGEHYSNMYSELSLRQGTNNIVAALELKDRICYDPPQFFSSPSFTVTPSIPAPSATQPTVAPAARPATPVAPAVRPPSPMQVDPVNVPLPPIAEVTPAHSLQQLPSPPTIAICQPPPVISTQPSRRQHHAFYQSEPISPERAALRQSLETLFNVSLPHCSSS